MLLYFDRPTKGDIPPWAYLLSPERISLCLVGVFGSNELFWSFLLVYYNSSYFSDFYFAYFYWLLAASAFYEGVLNKILLFDDFVWFKGF